MLQHCRHRVVMLAMSYKLQDQNTKIFLQLFSFWSSVTPAVACLSSTKYEMELMNEGNVVNVNVGNVVSQHTATWNSKSQPWTLFGCVEAASADSEVSRLCYGHSCQRRKRLMVVFSRCAAACLDVCWPHHVAESYSNPNECWQCCIWWCLQRHERASAECDAAPVCENYTSEWCCWYGSQLIEFHPILLRVFNYLHTSILHPATEIVDGRCVFCNLCLILKNRASDLLGLSNRSCMPRWFKD